MSKAFLAVEGNTAAAVQDSRDRRAIDSNCGHIPSEDAIRRYCPHRRYPRSGRVVLNAQWRTPSSADYVLYREERKRMRSERLSRHVKTTPKSNC